MKLIIEYLILLIPMGTELLFDWNRIMNKHKEDNHAQDIPVRIALATMVGLVLHWFFHKHFFQGFSYSLLMFFLFDPLINIVCKKPFFHKGKNFTDKFWEYTPPHAEIFVRLWFLSVGFAIYHYWYLIVD